jgi:class 3 adenylate cyclase
MPIFMDRHELKGLSAADVAAAHVQDLEVQDRFGVKMLTYWFDDFRGNAFCLIDAPDETTAVRVHEESHGLVPSAIIEIELSAVEAFLGRVADPAGVEPGAAPDIDSAFRAVLFTDIVDSTGMTVRLGDTRSVEMVRTHDSIVRRALSAASGREIKHTGDGIMASFRDATAAVTCACSIQRSFESFNRNSVEKLQVRIGIHSGEPVQDSNDLFGVTVQIAARICQHAVPDGIVVSDEVCRDLPGRFDLNPLGARDLKGFPKPVALYEVGCPEE